MAKKTIQKRDGVYQREDRGNSWWISWTDAQGRRRQRKTDAQNITQAKQIRAAELLRVEQARILGHQPPGKDTFEDVATRYLKYQKARLGATSYRREEGIVRVRLAQFNNVPLASIRRMDIQHYVTDRAAKVSAYTVQRELGVLKHIFSLALEWEIVPANPAQHVKSPKLPAGRMRYLQPTELKALLNVCPDGLREIVALAVSTGMRRGEILGLRYLDVDLSNRRIMLPQTKNGSGRIVYLNDNAKMVLESLPAGNPADRVFAEWDGPRVADAFERARGKVKLVDFRFHDLRHTAASWMRMSGADIHTVAQLLGHKDLRMAARYQHLSPDFLAEAVGKLDAVFGSLKAENRGERYQDVTANLALTDGAATSGEE
ncbi:MAG TPA: tyrosine-type recombinase/integrase [Blastocatellia bacterium]|nr:tyrosine-type recombinase/integrase [Blastocatellia bacterium]